MSEFSPLLTTSALLGLLHGLEPDHAAGITALASGKGVRRSFLTGIFFALGHVVLVIGWLIVLSLGVKAIPQGIMAAVGERLIEGILLLLGTIMVLQATHAHLHRHRGLEHSHPHLHLLGRGHGHEHRLPELLKISLVGSAFALSPPLSMMAFLSAVVIKGGFKLMLILPYTLTIMLSMGLVGAGVGAIARYLQSRGLFPAFKATAGALIIGYATASLLG